VAGLAGIRVRGVADIPAVIKIDFSIKLRLSVFEYLFAMIIELQIGRIR
jgi:hypothetical protein